MVRASFTNVRDKWLPELLAQPLVDLSVSKLLLVGTKSDLRDESVVDTAAFVTREEGEGLAKQLAAVKYMECSARTRDGLKQVYDEAIRAVLGLSTSSTIPLKSSGKRMSSITHLKTKILTDGEVHELADEATRRCSSRIGFQVLKQGWLEKKGGTTAMLPDGSECNNVFHSQYTL